MEIEKFIELVKSKGDLARQNEEAYKKKLKSLFLVDLRRNIEATSDEEYVNILQGGESEIHLDVMGIEENRFPLAEDILRGLLYDLNCVGGDLIYDCKTSNEDKSFVVTIKGR
ncbi:MAG: hypothetical protein WC178_04525 [Candidatus Paceibacterota bacterium]